MENTGRPSFIVIFGGGFLLFCVGALVVHKVQNPSAVTPQDAAATIMVRHLRDPNSATHSVTVLAQRKKGERTEYLIHDQIRAQNAFGAFEIVAHCMMFEVDAKQVYWNELTGVQRCEREVPQGDQLAFVKAGAGWTD